MRDQKILSQRLKIKAVRDLSLFAAALLLLLPLNSAQAAHTDEETAAFFAQIRQERIDFEQSLLAETNSKAAAMTAFNRQTQSDRLAFINSLPAQLNAEQAQSLDQFNADAAQKRQNFLNSLQTLPRNKFETAIDQNNAQLKIDIQNDLIARRKKFEQDQQQRISDFSNS